MNVLEGENRITFKDNSGITGFTATGEKYNPSNTNIYAIRDLSTVQEETGNSSADNLTVNQQSENVETNSEESNETANEIITNDTQQNNTQQNETNQEELILLNVTGNFTIENNESNITISNFSEEITENSNESNESSIDLQLSPELPTSAKAFIFYYSMIIILFVLIVVVVYRIIGKRKGDGIVANVTQNDISPQNSQV